MRSRGNNLQGLFSVICDHSRGSSSSFLFFTLFQSLTTTNKIPPNPSTTALATSPRESLTLRRCQARRERDVFSLAVVS